MSTTTSNLVASNTNVADYRANAQFIANALTSTCGWVDTNATGSVDLTTMTVPGANAYSGYRVYRMDDALQGTNPVFLKFEPGTGNGVTFFSIRLTIGNTHNGSGTLTGTQASTVFALGSNAANAATKVCYASGDTSRFSCAMHLDDGVTAALGFCFAVERTKDVSGANDNTAAVLLAAGYFANAFQVKSITMPFSGGMPPAEGRWIAPFSFAGTLSEFNSIRHVGFVQPVMGKILRPVLSFGVMASTDYPTAFNPISVTEYGTARTYLPLGSATGINQACEAGNFQSHPSRVLMLYQ